MINKINYNNTLEGIYPENLDGRVPTGFTKVPYPDQDAPLGMVYVFNNTMQSWDSVQDYRGKVYYYIVATEPNVVGDKYICESITVPDSNKFTNIIPPKGMFLVFDTATNTWGTDYAKQDAYNAKVLADYKLVAIDRLTKDWDKFVTQNVTSGTLEFFGRRTPSGALYKYTYLEYISIAERQVPPATEGKAMFANGIFLVNKAKLMAGINLLDLNEYNGDIRLAQYIELVNASTNKVEIDSIVWEDL